VKIVDAKEMSKDYEEFISNQTSKLKNIPTLVVIQANNDSASNLYVGNKRKACERVGISCRDIYLEESITTDEIIKLIELYNACDNVNGILV